MRDRKNVQDLLNEYDFLEKIHGGKVEESRSVTDAVKEIQSLKSKGYDERLIIRALIFDYKKKDGDTSVINLLMRVSNILAEVGD